MHIKIRGKLLGPRCKRYYCYQSRTQPLLLPQIVKGMYLNLCKRFWLSVMVDIPDYSFIFAIANQIDTSRATNKPNSVAPYQCLRQLISIFVSDLLIYKICISWALCYYIYYTAQCAVCMPRSARIRFFNCFSQLLIINEWPTISSIDKTIVSAMVGNYER